MASRREKFQELRQVRRRRDTSYFFLPAVGTCLQEPLWYVNTKCRLWNTFSDVLTAVNKFQWCWIHPCAARRISKTAKSAAVPYKSVMSSMTTTSQNSKRERESSHKRHKRDEIVLCLLWLLSFVG